MKMHILLLLSLIFLNNFADDATQVADEISMQDQENEVSNELFLQDDDEDIDNTIEQDNSGQSQGDEEKDLILLDQIEVVVYGEEAEIITKSDLDRPSLGGGYRSKEEIVFEKQVFLDAKKHHIPHDEETIDAYLTQIQREHNLTSKQLEEIFTGAGYTIEEGRQQLQIMQMINTMLDLKVRSNLIIPRKDVEEYYKNNPEIIEATYTLERAFVPQLKRMSFQQQYDVLVTYARTGKGAKGINWSEPFTIAHSDIAEDKQFIYTMQPGEISMPHSVAGGFELFRLVEKTPKQIKSLEDSYQDIVDILRKPRYEALMEEYRKSLADYTWVKYY